jgi:SAM-dependent methyltransferase
MTPIPPSEPAIHEDRRRAGSFGDDPELYDRARPSYPSAMVDELVARSPRTVLDVGCGTGIAGRLFAGRGCAVVGVEPDGRMAAVARGHGLAVEGGTFEDWRSEGRTFDLLVCGQAWHWVHPESGPLKAAQVVRGGGQVALFWNQGRHDADVGPALEGVYQRVAPDLEKYSILLRNLGRERFEETAASLAATGAFEDPHVTSYLWRRTYRRDEWIEHLMTHSDHRTMDPRRRADLFDGLTRVIDGAGGAVTIHCECSLVSARRTTPTTTGSG